MQDFLQRVREARIFRVLVSSDGIDYLSRYACNDFSFLRSSSLHQNLLCVSLVGYIESCLCNVCHCLHEKPNYSFVTLDRDPT